MTEEGCFDCGWKVTRDASDETAPEPRRPVGAGLKVDG